MNLFGWLGNLFDDAESAFSSTGPYEPTYLMDDDLSNPVNGLPMVGGISGVDMEGNVYGTDLSHNVYAGDAGDYGSAAGFDSDW